MKNQELEIFVLNELGKNSEISQRKLAKKFEVSLGKINFIIKELTKKGYVKIIRFAKAENKMKYRYILTPEGVENKIRITRNFVERKMKEYEKLLNGNNVE